MSQAVAQRIAFGPFVLEQDNARLVRDGRSVPLTPKAFDVLTHLAGHPDQLISKQRLLSAVWPDVIVSDASIKVCIREIRKALDDEAGSPRFIETVHRRGYRFVSPVSVLTEADLTPSSIAMPPRLQSLQQEPGSGGDLLLVGRDAELEVLHQSLAQLTDGQRRVVFVSGASGSGKTSLVEAFVRGIAGGAARVAVGHCFEQFGAGEPYLPFLEAISQLKNQEVLPAELRNENPDHTARAPQAHPGTDPRPPSQRLLREMADSIEALTATAPLILVLEDLHWADYSTLDLLCTLARRRGSARLLLIATYCPGESPDRERPLRTAIQSVRGACRELKLGALDEGAVAHYLARRVPGREISAQVARRLHDVTAGHPLFLTTLADELAERGDFDIGQGNGDVPQSIKAVIDRLFERLSAADQRLLEGAAVAGIEFSAAALAAANGQEDVVVIERACDELSRRHRFLESAGTADWPDGTLANRYRFLHRVYHSAITDRISAARRVQMHRAVAQRLEAAWTAGPGGEAAELALHFERGREIGKAVTYLRQCADHATRQYAHREAVDYLRRALALIDLLPAEQRSAVELPLLKSLAVHLQVTRGYSAPQVLAIHRRAYELCNGTCDTATAFPVLWGIWVSHKVRSELHEARQLAEQLLAMAEHSGDAALLLQAYQAISVTSLCLGEPRRCCGQIELAANIYVQQQHAGNAQVYGQDPCVATAAFGALALWITGDEAAALACSERALRLARELSQPSTLALALHFAAMLHQLRDQPELVARFADEAVRISNDNSFSLWQAGGAVLQGWALAALGNGAVGIAQMRGGIDAWLATGSGTYYTYFLGLLADGLLRDGREQDAMVAIDQALTAAADMPEGLYQAELYRLKGRCLLTICQDESSRRMAAEALGRAVAIAEAQGAVAFNTRAVNEMNLCDVPGEGAAHASLRQSYQSFTAD